jgi:nitroreductase
MAGQNAMIKLIRQRRSVRNYTDEPVSKDDVQMVIESGLYAPSGSGNIENDMFFTVIQNKTVLGKINKEAKLFAQKSELPWLQELGSAPEFNCLYNAPVLIIISYKKDTPSAVYDCSAAAENMLLAAESLGLGGCWLYFPLMAFQHENSAELLAELNIPESYKPITSIITGHKADGAAAVVIRKTEHIRYI